MAKGYQKEQGLSMTNLGLSLEELQGQPLELFAREEVIPVLYEEFPTATEVLGKHRSLCLTFYHLPERHWRHIRTGNVLERAFKKVRRRTSVVGRFPGETSALMMVFGVLEEVLR